jgi:hypothetical protein
MTHPPSDQGNDPNALKYQAPSRNRKVQNCCILLGADSGRKTPKNPTPFSSVPTKQPQWQGFGLQVLGQEGMILGKNA